VSLNSLLKDPNAEQPSRVIRDDISDSDIEVIYSVGTGMVVVLRMRFRADTSIATFSSM
jgi:hypothetical protein